MVRTRSHNWALLGHFYGVADRGTGIGHDIEVVRAEQLRRGRENAAQAVSVACFFIGHEDHAQVQFRREPVGRQFFSEQQHAHNGLLVVLHAASVEPVAFTAYLPGVAAPGGQISGGHYIRMAEQPEGAAAFARHARHQVGAQPLRHARVRGVQTGEVCDAAGLEPISNAADFFQLARTAVVRSQSLAGGKHGLQLRHPIFTAGQAAQQHIQVFKHGVPLSTDKNIKGRQGGPSCNRVVPKQYRGPVCARKPPQRPAKIWRLHKRMPLLPHRKRRAPGRQSIGKGRLACL